MPKYTLKEQEDALKKVIDLINEYHLTIITEHTIKILPVQITEEAQ